VLCGEIDVGRTGTVVQSPAPPPLPPSEFLAQMDGDDPEVQMRILPKTIGSRTTCKNNGSENSVSGIAYLIFTPSPLAQPLAEGFQPPAPRRLYKTEAGSKRFNRSTVSLRSNRLGFSHLGPSDRFRFRLKLFIYGAIAPVVGSSLTVGDGENHRIIAVQFIDYRIRKLANDKAPSLLVKLWPAQRVLGN